MRNPGVMRSRLRASAKNGNCCAIARHSPRSDMRIRHAYHIAYARSPSSVELKRSLQFVRDGKDENDWVAFCQALLASSEFRNIE